MTFISFDQVDPGILWIPDDADNVNRDLFDGKRVAKNRVPIPWYRRATSFWTDGLWGDIPQISPALSSTDYEAMFDASENRSIFGRGVVVRQNGVLRSVDPRFHRYVRDKMEKSRIIGHIIGMPFIENPSVPGVMNAITEPDRIIFTLIPAGVDQTAEVRIYEFSGYTVGTLLSRSSVQNISAAAFGTGVSDYPDIKPIIEEIEKTVHDRGTVLRRFTSPHLMGPEGARNADGTFSTWGEGESQFLPITEDQARYEYLIWDAELEANFRHVSELIDDLHVASSIPVTAFGMRTDSGSNSGVSRERQMVSALFKLRRLRREIEGLIQHIYGESTTIGWQESPFGITSAEVDDAVKLKEAEIIDAATARSRLGIRSSSG